jgi:hypothetical protein
MTLMHEWSRNHFEFHSAPVYLFWCGQGLCVSLSVAARHHSALVPRNCPALW